MSECSLGFAGLALARGGGADSRLKDTSLVFLNCFLVWLFKDVMLLVMGFGDICALLSVLLRGDRTQQHTCSGLAAWLHCCSPSCPLPAN